MTASARNGLQGPPRAALVVLAAVAAAVVLLCATCNYGEVTVVEPAAKSRGALTLSIQPDPEDAAVARELGWTSGIPGAEVTVSPGAGDTATGPPVATLESDASGAAGVPDLPDTTYLVEVRRLLTAAETARLAPGEDVIGAFAKVVVKRGSTIVQAPTSRRHSVVISEWSFMNAYAYDGYLELANNSDTTVYLDGLVIGLGFAVEDASVWNWCEVYAPVMNDPDGIWTHWFDSLPGTGHTYPLAPGALAVIATDAIDHSAIVAGGLDLSHADFEFVGETDADNPGVPNSIRLGPEPDRMGHGLILSSVGHAVVFVALPVDTAALPRQVLPNTEDRVYFRVPRARVLETISLLHTYEFNAPLCPHLVDRSFDRYRARVMVGNRGTGGPDFSVNRKVALTRPDGRKILQHTRTSNADLVRAPRTPGQLP